MGDRGRGGARGARARRRLTGRESPLRTAPLVAVGALVGLAAALPTWLDAGGSLQVATGIASTSNPGNLTAPLRLEQILGTWLSGSYRHQAATGVARVATYALVVATVIAVLIGVVHVVRIRAWALAGWAGLLVALWLGLTAYGTTWTDAKLLMLTSPVVVLLAWAGVSGLRATPLPLVAPLLGLAIVGGVIASDVLQYHGGDLAPTARYDEMASLDSRYAGHGPVLFTDFDEWSVYELRDLDIGGPDFIFPPVGLVGVARNHGDLVDLDRVKSQALTAYPLIITRRDPTASRPPAAYQLAWEGRYYQVWSRTAGAPASFGHLRLSGQRPVACSAVERVARIAGRHHVDLVGARPVERRPGRHLPRAASDLGRRPPDPGRAADDAQGQPDSDRGGSALGSVERLGAGGDHAARSASRSTAAGWPSSATRSAVTRSIPIRRRRRRSPWPPAPTRWRSAAAPRARAPGDGGSAILHAVFLTPAGSHEVVQAVAPARWRSLCGQRYDWLEATTV